MAACNVVYLRSSMLLVQTHPMMVKQLQHSLATSPAVRYRSLTMHCPQVVEWCYIDYLYSDWHLWWFSAFFGGKMGKISTKFS